MRACPLYNKCKLNTPEEIQNNGCNLMRKYLALFKGSIRRNRFDKDPGEVIEVDSYKLDCDRKEYYKNLNYIQRIK